MTEKRFTSPFFIVGMPRSGTKLLRELLNQNPTIGIPIAESHFIPRMVQKFGNPPKFNSNGTFHQFYEDLRQTRFFWYMKGFGQVLTEDEINKIPDKTSWSSIFDFIFRFYAPPERSEAFIWGDKCPGYQIKIVFLKSVFPKSKFLHIIRDPRDCCLSMKKAWGASLYTSAQMWEHRIAVARTAGAQVGEDYMEVFFESLLEDPEATLIRICKFLECDYIPQMTKMSRPGENLGAAIGQTDILSSNLRKYPGQLSVSEIKRIEELVYPVIRSTPYSVDYAINHKPLNPLVCRIIVKYNRWQRLKFDIRTKGVREGLKFYFGLKN